MKIVILRFNRRISSHKDMPCYLALDPALKGQDDAAWDGYIILTSSNYSKKVGNLRRTVA
jgi:hypothetical protein